MGNFGQMGKERAGFSSPFEVTIPSDCEGWEEMYAYHLLFDGERRDFDESRFWFQERMHAAEPLFPFDALTWGCGVLALNQASSRLFVVPPSLGVESRVINGYVYVAANSVTDEAALTPAGGAVRKTWRLLLPPLGRAVRALDREGRGRYARSPAARRA